jgi:glutamate/aspartate transport system substrate-binding protein
LALAPLDGAALEFATMHISLHADDVRTDVRAAPARARTRVTASLLFAAALAAVLPAAAGAKGAASAAAEAPSELPAGPHPVLDRIKASGRIVLAHREGSVPFAYYDADKHPIGYAVDLCKDLAETVRRRLGLKALNIVYMPVNTSTRIPAIVEGKADLECGTTTNNAERRQKVAFTVPHYITGSRYLVRADSPIEELSQFEGHVLVATAGSTQFKQIDQANRDRLLNIKVLQVPDNAKAMQMVSSGQADGFALDDVQLYGLIAESPNPAKFKVVGKFLTIEPLAIMMSKDDPAFKKIVDDEMKRMIRAGEAEALYDKWFMKPIPPKNVAMNLPMNYLLRDSWKYPSDIVGN